MATPYATIGQLVGRAEGPEKVTGKALYPADICLPGTLVGACLRSPYPYARIVSIDTAAARQLPGVHAVLTSADLPEALVGRFLRDLPVLARDVVRFAGQKVAAVAADNEETAERALALIDCDFDALPAALTTDEALSENAPLVHDQLHSYRMNSVLARDWHPVAATNIAHQALFTKGDIDRGFAAADEIFDDTFHSQQVQHCSLEQQRHRPSPRAKLYRTHR